MRYKLLKDIGVFKKDTILKIDEIPIEIDGVQTFETEYYIKIGDKTLYPTKLSFRQSELESFIEQGYIGLVENEINKEDLLLENLSLKMRNDLLEKTLKNIIFNSENNK